MELRSPQKRRDIAAVATFAASLAVAAVITVRPRLVESLIGRPPAGELVAPEELPEITASDGGPFLAARDVLTIHVAEATTLREFLDRNRLNKPNQRRQIVQQLGAAADSAPIAAGTTFRITLTPRVEDVPGAGGK